MNELHIFLSRVPLFAGMPSEALALLSDQMRRRPMPANAPVLYRGDPAGSLYVILSGRVKVHQATVSGEEVIFDVLGPGAAFGELSLLDDQPRSADITTTEATVLAMLDGDVLRGVVEKHPPLAWALLRILAQRVREQNEKIEMLMTRDVAGRVAAQLLKLAAAHGKPQPGSPAILIDVDLSQSDIAAFVGATRERVSRALSTFRTQNLIVWDKSHSRWLLRNPEALAKRAEV